MSKIKKVSIIITTYGGSKNVIKAVESCIKQTYQNIEIIVVDDNGINTENQLKTEKYLKRYIDNNEIIYIKHVVNKNASASRNTGIKKAKGFYISLLDDDDEYLAEKIERQVDAFETLDKSYGIIYCSMIDKIGSKVYELKATADGNKLFDFLIMNVSACTSNIMFKKDDWQQINGFDEGFNRHQDWEFLLRMLYNKKIYGVDYVGVIKNTQVITKRFNADKAEQYRLKYIALIKKIINNDEKKLNKVLSHEYLELAKLFLREKNIGKTFFYLRNSKYKFTFLYDIIKKPFKIIIEKYKMKKYGKIILKR